MESTKNSNQPSQDNIQNQQVNPDGKSSSLRICIIVNEANLRDIKYYNEEFKRINKGYKDKVSLIFIGYRPEYDTLNSLDGVTYKYIAPVSIIHYFKMLKEVKPHLLFIPLINDTYNATSENMNKYFEAALMGVPVMATNIYPYNKIIGDKQNGFIYNDKDSFFTYLVDLFKKENIELLRICGGHARADVTKNFNYSDDGVNVIADLFP